MNISPSKMFYTILLPENFHPNRQAAFGHCEHEHVLNV